MSVRWSSCSASVMVLGMAMLAGSSASVAQMSMAGHDMGAMKEIPAPEKLPVPVKMTGIGNSHLAITATPEAQMWFDQGLNLLHDFWDYESEKSFEQGIRVDPNCAMCYWGLYQALMFRHGMGTGYSDKALAGAVKLKDKVGKQEQGYIEAAVAANEAEKAVEPGAKTDSEKEIAIWRRIVKEYPTDLQAKIFLSG